MNNTRIVLTPRQVYDLLWDPNSAGPCRCCAYRCGSESLCGGECQKFDVRATLFPKEEKR